MALNFSNSSSYLIMWLFRLRSQQYPKKHPSSVYNFRKTLITALQEIITITIIMLILCFLSINPKTISPLRNNHIPVAQTVKAVFSQVL